MAYRERRGSGEVPTAATARLDAGDGSGGPPVTAKMSGDADEDGEQDGGLGKARGRRR